MANYYKQLKKFVEQEKLSGKQILLDEFEIILRQKFGFGTRKTFHRWLDNFQDANMIKIQKSENNIWFVDILC